MSLNAFVNRLHAWVRAEGGEVRQWTYPRLATGRGGGGHVRALYLSPAGPPKGLVVNVHATGNDLYFPFVQLFRFLLSRGYAVFSFDLDGHGVGSSHVLSREHVDSMLPEAMAEARRCLPGAKVYLLGHSLGALLCLRYLAQASPPASPVVAAALLTTPVSGRIALRSPVGELRAAVRSSFWRAAPSYGYWGLLPAIGRFKRGQYPMRFAAGEGGATVGAYVRFVDDLVADSASLLLLGLRRRPCLLLYGGRDALTPPAQAGELSRQVWAETRFRVIGRETHFTLALNKECFAEVVEWFEGTYLARHIHGASSLSSRAASLSTSRL